MNPTGLLDWDTDQIATALRLGKDDVRKYFTDGRHVSFLIERRLRTDMGYKLADSKSGF